MYVCVCVCVCVCLRDRERDKLMNGLRYFKRRASWAVEPSLVWFLRNNDNSWEVQKDRVISQSWWNRGPWDASSGCIRLVNAVHLLRCSSGFLDATSSEVFGDRKADEDEGWLQQPLASALGENWLHSLILSPAFQAFHMTGQFSLLRIWKWKRHDHVFRET